MPLRAEGKFQQAAHTEVRQAWGFGQLTGQKNISVSLEIPRDNPVLQYIKPSLCCNHLGALADPAPKLHQMEGDLQVSSQAGAFQFSR